MHFGLVPVKWVPMKLSIMGFGFSILPHFVILKQYTWFTFHHQILMLGLSLSWFTSPHTATIRSKRGGFVKKGLQIKSMRAVVQRVTSASVEVEGRIVSEIGPGLVVLVGIHESDVESDADYICRKVLNMRLFTNEKTGRAWDQNVMQRDYGVLLVSQFTLYGILKGNKPDFHVAMSPQKAKSFYESLVEKFRKSYKSDAVKDGVFAAMMKVNLVNDGPVTMQLDSSQPSKSKCESADEEPESR